MTEDTECRAPSGADSIRKLTDFRTKVQALGAAGKLGAEDAARLDAGAAAAIGCIETMGTWRHARSPAISFQR